MLNQYNYHCPSCQGQLNSENEVEFLVERNNKEQSKIYLLPTPKSYGYRTVPKIVFEPNEEVNFKCAHCGESLVSKAYPKFVKIHLKVTDKVLIDVFFSRVNGVRKTYVGLEDFLETYGAEMLKL